ncbi:TetR/AcrR family transcriptional regulator [Nocardia alni]|uniref:TetR/AcrR family transcriptional regulator n=1 Tax=Nocardia alni TaxID=2815723 RepID=UPI001C24D219|nr:TetR/AcrR family transcriptional regulator [Nocardia alni]
MTGTLRDRTEAAILDAAAEVLAARGPAASMSEIATAAGLGRATLYRYFPTREALLAGLLDATIADLIARIADAELDTLPVDEALARLVRGFLTVGTKYTALLQPGNMPEKSVEVESQLTEPIRALLIRGIAEGALRPDVSPDLLLDMFGGLVEKSLIAVLRGHAGVEQASAAVITLFLDGARSRSPQPGSPIA